MFEILRLSGTQDPGIALETRRKRRIENARAPSSNQRQVCLYRHILGEHRDWILRKPACGGYNCFGHVWAARRTAIYEQSEVDKILSDDGYRKLPPEEFPIQGDLVLYWEQTRPSVWHVGTVSELRYLTTPEGKPIGKPAIWVLSKWGDGYGEALHRLDDVHSPFGKESFPLEVWTDRPTGKAP